MKSVTRAALLLLTFSLVACGGGGGSSGSGQTVVPGIVSSAAPSASPTPDTLPCGAAAGNPGIAYAVNDVRADVYCYDVAAGAFHAVPLISGPSNNGPGGFLSIDGKTLYISDGTSVTAYAISGSAAQKEGQVPVSAYGRYGDPLFFTSNGNVYVADGGTVGLYSADLTKTIIGRTHVFIAPLAFDPSSNNFYSLDVLDQLVVTSGTTLQVTATQFIPNVSNFSPIIAVRPDGKYVYVGSANSPSNPPFVSVVDTTTFKVVSELTVPEDLGLGAVFRVVNHLLYVLGNTANQATFLGVDQATIIDMNTNQVQATFALGTEKPFGGGLVTGYAITPDGRQILADYDTSKSVLASYDAQTGALLGKVQEPLDLGAGVPGSLAGDILVH